MSEAGHDLHSLFPGHDVALQALKTGNAHFCRRAQSYHTVTTEIQRIEAGIEAASDARVEALKRQRLHLLDEIAVMLKQQDKAA